MISFAWASARDLLITCAASGPGSRGGGRHGGHGTAATAAGRGGVVPLEGDLGRAAKPVTPTSVPVPRPAKPAAAWPSALSTGSGSREPRRPAGGGLGTDSASRPSSRQPARKSCPPAPPIAAMRWAACGRSRSPTTGAVRESTHPSAMEAVARTRWGHPANEPGLERGWLASVRGCAGATWSALRWADKSPRRGRQRRGAGHRPPQQDEPRRAR